MSKQTDGAGIIGLIGLAIFFIVVYPFIWLYEQVGGKFFLAIVLGIPAAVLIYKDRKKGRLKPSQGKTECAEERAIRKSREAEEFNARNKQIIQQREQQAQREYFLKKHQEKDRRKAEPVKARVHTIETDDGYLAIEWRQQFDEIKKAWHEGDYDFARTWLQKLAYSIASMNAPQVVHDKFKMLMVAFTRDDPLYADVMRVALPVIAAKPGIVQSTLSKQFPQFDAEQFRYAMYYSEIIGDVVRVKKGRSYALTIPSKEDVHAERAKTMKESTQQLLMAYIAATLNKMPDEWGRPRTLSGLDVVAALWPLNDLFRPHLADVGLLPYEQRHEADADAAIEGFIGRGVSAWTNLPAGVWRVLMERHLQALVVASANEAAGNSAFMKVPEALPDASIPGAAMIYMLHGMALPYPVKQRSSDEFPQPDAPVSRWLH